MFHIDEQTNRHAQLFMEMWPRTKLGFIIWVLYLCCFADLYEKWKDRIFKKSEIDLENIFFVFNILTALAEQQFSP